MLKIYVLSNVLSLNFVLILLYCQSLLKLYLYSLSQILQFSIPITEFKKYKINKQVFFKNRLI